jgi:predicted RecB family nuclease
MRPEPRLSKSRYLTGLQCVRRLWLGWHDPEPKSEPAPGTVLAVGTDVGTAARQVVPSGVLVDEGPDQHERAVERTRELMQQSATPAIFEAAFTFDRIRVRADILERLPGGTWRLAEVKSSTRTKPEHLHDLSVQAHVISGCGIPIEEMLLIHVDTTYVRRADGIDWFGYFKRYDVTTEVRELLPLVPGRVAEMHAILGLPDAPEVRPSRHCSIPFDCEFWNKCTAEKPRDWIFNLPRLRPKQFEELGAQGIESMRDIPPEFPLSSLQRRVVDAMVSGQEFVSIELGEALSALSPPATYLDFETFSPAIPVYVETSPYQRVPFQWSAHHDDGHLLVEHFEFLADGDRDPRRQFAETLLAAIEPLPGPIIVYSPFEASVLRQLALHLPDLSQRLLALKNRLQDLLPIMRGHVVPWPFLGSFSIKDVAPALAPGFSYSDLLEVADGSDASTAFYQLASSKSVPDERRAGYRRALLAYCERDTLGLLTTHRALQMRCRLGSSPEDPFEGA